MKVDILTSRIHLLLLVVKCKTIPSTDLLARRPGELATRQQVDMEVVDALLGPDALVDHKTIPRLVQPKLCGHLTSHHKQPPKLCCILLGSMVNLADGDLLGDEEEVGGGDRVQVVEAQDMLILVDHRARLDVSGSHLPEDGLSRLDGKLRRRRG